MSSEDGNVVSTQTAKDSRDAHMGPGHSYRYRSLALAANSYRLIGTLLKGFGMVVLVAGGFLVLRLDSADVEQLQRVPGGWVIPLGLLMATLLFGFGLLFIGIVQDAHGEALLALADIAVATASTAHPDQLSAWDRYRSLPRFLGSVALASGIVLVLVIKAGGAASDIWAKRHLSVGTVDVERVTDLANEADSPQPGLGAGNGPTTGPSESAGSGGAQLTEDQVKAVLTSHILDVKRRCWEQMQTQSTVNETVSNSVGHPLELERAINGRF